MKAFKAYQLICEIEDEVNNLICVEWKESKFHAGYLEDGISTTITENTLPKVLRKLEDYTYPEAIERIKKYARDMGYQC